MNESKLILKKLLLKYDYLESYLEEVNFKYAKYNTQFLKEYYELNPPPKKPESPPKEDENPEELKEEVEGESEEPKQEDEGEPKESEEESKHEGDDDIECDGEMNEENELLREALNKLYKKLSLKTHPDKHGGNNEKFIEVLNAYKSKNILKLIMKSLK